MLLVVVVLDFMSKPVAGVADVDCKIGALKQKN